MSIEKITPQIAALYIGQKCEYPNDDGGEIVCFLTGVASDGIETTYKRKRDGVCGDILSWKQNSPTQKRFAGNVKFHLRSPDTLTEKECRMLYHLETGETWFDHYGGEENAPPCKNFWFEDEYKGPTGSPLVWLKMLEMGIDLFGLIPAGLAKEIGDGTK